MRELKFRRWNSKRDRFEYFELSGFFNDADLYDICSCADGPFEQYTGFNDRSWEEKDRIEVWEGDIVESFNRDRIGVVVFDCGVFGINWIPYGYSNLGQFEDWIVVGNIHENQDLLDD